MDNLNITKDITKNIDLVTNFCLTHDTRYLESVDNIVKNLFIENSKKVMIGEKGYKNIAHLILNFYQLFDDGTPKPYKVKEFDWIFLKDDMIDCTKLTKTATVKYRTTITINGIDLQLLKSALQKYIRRNMTHKAIWCGLEWGLLRCDKVAEDKNLKSVITNLRNRLRIIYLEDISIANLNLLEKMNQIIDILNYDKNPSGKDMDKTIVSILSDMSQSYHTRICSFVNSLYKIYPNKQLMVKQKEYLKYFPNVKKMYTYIEDHKNLTHATNLLNTLREKNPICFYYAQKLNFEENEKGKYGKNNEVFPIIRKVIDSKYLKYLTICEKWYNEIKNSEAFLAYFIPMLIVCFPVQENGRLSDYFDYTNDYKNLVMYNIEETPIELEKYVMDMHTKEGNRRGLKKDNLAGNENFVKHASYVNDEYKINEVAMELKRYYNFTKLLNFGKVDEEFLVGNKDDKDVKDVKKDKEEVEIEDKEEIEDNEDEYVIDLKKIKSKKSKKPIVLEDDISESEVEFEVEEENDTEGEIEKVKKTEKDFFEYIARAQVPTSGSKFDSYYAKMKKDYSSFKRDEIVFVKGPFENDKVYDILKLFVRIKKLMNIPYINIEKVELKLSNDYFVGEVDIQKNVGKNYIRNKLSEKDKKNKMYTFIIYKNIFGNDFTLEKYGYLKTQKSEAWINTQATVVNWGKMDSNFHHFEVEDLKNKKFMLQYIQALYFRYLFGIVDAANRNFLIANDTLYGIDEENIDMEKDSNFSKLNKQFEYIKKNWSKVKDEIEEILENWKTKSPDVEKILSKPTLITGFTNRLNKLIEDPQLFF